jgi:2,3-bisphosphoglycerate-independent phosphoglycerate mutase
MTPYQERFGITGAVVSAVDLVNGIGHCAGFEVLRVPGITGYLDTNYEGKVAAALDALDRHDFVYLHVEAPDETAHEGRPDLKVQAIEDFDRRVVAPCLNAARARGDLRVLIAPDHITSLASRTHAPGPVPFALYGPGVRPNGLRAFSESEAARAGVLFPDGHTLAPAMIREQEIAFPLVP